MSVKLISITPDIENVISYCARVSNPENQENFETAPKLLAYLIKHNHWSPFELGNLVIEIETTRGVAAQILRHRSFTFQEFSQRYTAVDESGLEIYAARRQDTKNRQNSIDDLSAEVKAEWEARQLANWKTSFEHYKWALDQGIAKECARTVLPLGTKTRLYMAGTVRSWLHYVELRADKATQLEHRDIAEACKKILCEQLPNVSKAMGWVE